ncbi:MAG: hypothetical protein LUD72_04365 [Bacteroidales bacterium]|nr:hypothetical protein [Bacteroidales bacterium]
MSGIHHYYEPTVCNKRVLFAIKMDDEYYKATKHLKEVKFKEIHNEADILDCIRQLRKEGPYGYLKASGVIKNDPFAERKELGLKIVTDKKGNYVDLVEKLDDYEWEINFIKYKWSYLPMIGYAIALTDNFGCEEKRDKELTVCYGLARRDGNYLYNGK